MSNSTFIATLGLLKGYYQMPLTEEAKEISVFVTPNELYYYNVMSFGMRKTPSAFLRLNTFVISGLEGV